MNDKKMDKIPEQDLAVWSSTYGRITAERILEKYKVHLSSEALTNAISKPKSPYHQLLKLPLKNVFNGIILQQARTYQVYAEKLFIDYLLSGETAKTEEAFGGQTREDLETERQNLLNLTNTFQEHKLAHNVLIAESQQRLMRQAEDWQQHISEAATNAVNTLATQDLSITEEKVAQAFHLLLSEFDGENLSSKNPCWLEVEKLIGYPLSENLRQIFIKETVDLVAFFTDMSVLLSPFFARVTELGVFLRQSRANFQELIVRANNLIQSLPGYRHDIAQEKENKESLYFDTEIGEF